MKENSDKSHGKTKTDKVSHIKLKELVKSAISNTHHSKPVK